MEATPKEWVNEYYKWLKDNTVIRDLPTGWSEIATPFLDRHNDGLVIYLKFEKDVITLSDDGYIISDLETCGCPISSPSRKSLLNSFLQKYGIELLNNELTARTNIKNFPQKKHMFIQAMLAVNDMFMVSKKHNVNIFLDDLTAFFEDNNIYATPDIQIQGVSGFTHRVDFVIPKTKSKPERFIYAINSPSKSNAKITLFNWNDIQQTRTKNSQLYVFLNDNRSFSDDIIEAFSAYRTNPILWSKRLEHIDKLVV